MNPSSGLSYALSGKIMLSAIILLFTVVLLILFLHLYVRWHVRRRASRRARRRQRLVFAAESQKTSAHGLDPSILASLPVFLFCHNAEENDESGECAVCLNEFKDGEKIRCLPQCTHRFHIDCIDMWFHSHSSCPLCRAEVDFVAETDSRETSATAENELEIRIEIPASRGDGTSGGEEQRSLAEEEQVKRISRMVLIRWLLVRDPRFYCGGVSGSVIDVERGDGESTVPTTTTAVDPSR